MAALPSRRLAVHLLAALGGWLCIPAHAVDAVASLGKERAARSPLQWDVGDTTHPTLGAIQFAMLKNPVTTAVGEARISSRAFVSCEKSTRRIAIELANGRSPDDPGGLKPRTMPRLACHRMAASGGPSPVPDDLESSWQVNELGDALTRGLRPSRLRQCLSIGIVQEVVMPPGSAQGTARVAFEIAPYGKALDTVFATCGEATAYAQAAPAAAAMPVASSAAPTPARPAERPWKSARATSSGKTNLRAGPALDAAVVAQLDAGAVIQVQATGGKWWRVRATAEGRPVEGYIRQDRIRFK